ncbi:MAG: tyrosine-type recombinase/integrase [Nitrospirota bacterium]
MKLQQHVTDYIAFKQALGGRFQTEAQILKAFPKAMGDVDITQVEPSAVQTFLAGKGAVTSFWHQKFGVLTRFYRFLMIRNYVDSSPLPKTAPKCPEPMKPYIYTPADLRRLLAATNRLQSPLSPLRACTFHTLILTLYSTGLRIGEALALTLADVNLPESLIMVRTSKFFKTRLVPIGPRLCDRLRAYVQRRRKLPCPQGEDSTFFVTRSGNPLTYDQARKVFPILRNLAGIHREKEARYQPRVHDIRHTMAVHRLLSWYREGADVQRLLPQLSTYLGHRDIAATQRYLTIIPELRKQASRRFEHYAMQEVENEN